MRFKDQPDRPNREEILDPVAQLTLLEPPPGPFCVTYIFGDPRLVELARGKSDQSGAHQITVWFQSTGDRLPAPPCCPDWLTVLDISDLWSNPPPMGRPQGLMYLVADRMWRLWKRPFSLNDIDVYSGPEHIRCMSEVSDPNLPATFARKGHHPYVFGGIAYVHGSMGDVVDRVINRMTGQKARSTHWEEHILYSAYKDGLIDLVDIPVQNEEWETVLDRDPDTHWKAMKQNYTEKYNLHEHKGGS